MKSKLSRKIFHSKVLLFGEHIINKGATGLAVPFDHFYGMLKPRGDITDKSIAQSNHSLQQVADYIVHNDELEKLYDTNQMLEDIEKGLYFDSNIPQGYGLGSSGALVAAIYHQYRLNKKKDTPVSDVKKELAEIESHFHGKSSGLDPIVCYLNKAVLIKNGEVSRTFDVPPADKTFVNIFLINTHIERKTSPFVNLFLEKCRQQKFMNVVEKSLIPVNDIAIDSFMKRKYSQLLKSVKIISQLQFDLLPEFIPAKFKEPWLQGLKHGEFHLKICGAGGGGFIIGLAKTDANLPLLLRGFDIIELMKL